MCIVGDAGDFCLGCFREVDTGDLGRLEGFEGWDTGGFQGGKLRGVGKLCRGTLLGRG